MAGPDSDQNPRLTKAGSTTLEQELVRASLAPTTRAAYMRSVNMLRKYLSSVCPGSKFFPVSRTNLAGFITHLFAAKYASSTILSTVSAISFSHKIVGLGDPADNFYIKKLLAGVHKKASTVDLRKPIDLCMLGNLAKVSIEVIPDQFTQLCISAMFMLAFHGFLRIGEITVRSGVPAEHVIQRKDLVVVPGSTRHGKAKPSLQLTIRHGKHQKVGKPIVLEIDSQSRECPVTHICRYLKTRGQSTGPLFVFPDRTPITRTYFASQLRACLSYAGYDPTGYKCHSFRIGSTTTAAARGFTDIQIQTMGRWKSAAFRKYIRIPMMKLY